MPAELSGICSHTSVWSTPAKVPDTRTANMTNAPMWLAIITIAVVMPTLILAAFIAHRTGSTKGLVDVGEMVAQIITAIYRP
jgi:nicotinamide riboside transporter PnuC